MLPSKSTKFFSEVNDFLTSSEKGITRILNLYQKLELHKIKIGHQDFPQASYRRSDLLLCLLLFPVFSIKNVWSYLDGPLNDFFEAKKNTLYRLKNDHQIDWRHILNLVNRRLFKQINMHGDCVEPKSPRCLIVDDTDFEKTSYKTEHISRIWSHSLHRTILGFKALVVGYWDGKSFFALDFSLHKEKGKSTKTPYGLTPKQMSEQYQMTKDAGSPAETRENELTQSKTVMAIQMVISLIRSGKLPVDYVLMDSWFFCFDFMQKIRKLFAKTHLLAMAKMGKTRYTFEEKKLTLRELADLMKKRKQVKFNRALCLYTAEVIAEYKGYPVKFFFCKNSKKGKWHVLVTSNTRIGVVKAYQTYSLRWSVEVFFKEAKSYLGMGKSQSQDFCGQIADITIAMMVYNVLALTKRFESYETLGILFRQAGQQVTEMNIYNRIWQFILELLQLFAEIIDGDFNELIFNNMKQPIEDNKLLKLLEKQEYLKLAG